MNSRVVGGILLVSGTTIGAGMLALPVLTGEAGLVWSIFLFVSYWIVSLFTALLLLEVNLWFPGGTNIISMARYTLGKTGETVSWIVYLLLLYSLTAAYLAGSGPLLEDAVKSIFNYTMPPWMQPLPLLFIFGSFVYHGTRWVDYLNRILMLGMVLVYGLLLALSFPHVRLELLMRQEPTYLWLALPVVVTSFGFHIIIPSLKTYLKEDVKSLRKVILLGSAIPLLVYICWEVAILGIVPSEGSPSLKEALHNGDSATRPLTALLKSSYISLFARFFSFFAITTSFLGVTLSLSDFLLDGLNIKKTHLGKILVTILTFFPPLLYVWFYPKGFILALQYAGVFVSILLGILPIMMAWLGRKNYGKDAIYQAPGGATLFTLGILFFLGVIAIVLVQHNLS